MNVTTEASVKRTVVHNSGQKLAVVDREEWARGVNVADSNKKEIGWLSRPATDEQVCDLYSAYVAGRARGNQEGRAALREEFRIMLGIDQ